MKITLAAPDSFLLEAWQKACASLENVQIYCGSVFDVACDALVSPANSFGFMDGGIDAQYVDAFGAHVQDRLRMGILTRHNGELLVGAAELIETGDQRHPYLIAAPTMRVPMVLPSDTVNPYLATRAVLSLARDHAERIRSLCFPGMGTGVGRVPAEICARQMRAAIERSQMTRQRLPSSWSEASHEHQLLYTGTPTRIQY